jgi:hypothetical protein
MNKSINCLTLEKENHFIFFRYYKYTGASYFHGTHDSKVLLVGDHQNPDNHQTRTALKMPDLVFFLCSAVINLSVTF